MKKATLLAFAFAMFAGAQSIVAQEPAENVQYVSDPSQGVLLNRMQDNWFITAEGGANIYFSHKSIHRDLSDRFSPAASIYAGKWFSPVFGARAGVTWMQLKGLADGPDFMGTLKYDYRPDGFYKQRTQEIGPVFDLMVNLTNWWCGYKPNRVYNCYAYVGGGAYFGMQQGVKEENGTFSKDGLTTKDSYTSLGLRCGIINSFNVSKRVALSLDIRSTLMDVHAYNAYNHVDKMFGSLNAYLGVTFNLGKTNWSAPVVPVCPPAENCDALRARLSAAEARVADLERQLQDCLNRKPEVVEAEPEALATIYFPIGVSRLTREDKNIVNAVADVLKADASKKYDVKGYADNYTGSDAINNRLRNQRAGNVVKQLVSRGVSAYQVQAVPVQGNLHGDNEALVSLDRCAVIIER